MLNESYNYLISFSFLLIILSYLFCLLSIWFWIDQVESILSFSRFYSINLLYLPLVRVFFWHSHTNLIYKLHIISSCLHRREPDMNKSKDILRLCEVCKQHNMDITWSVFQQSCRDTASLVLSYVIIDNQCHEKAVWRMLLEVTYITWLADIRLPTVETLGYNQPPTDYQLIQIKMHITR